jgi:hypothetical protein
MDRRAEAESRQACGSPEAVVDLIARVFRDIAEKKALPDFRIARGKLAVFFNSMNRPAL